ncbi:hypothetical protein [Leptodesmis sp.]|uniref:hypothetical protein n=1 Tax=Leptodesmis sp. TaxID=3100501 RepID=UPI004053492D
MDRLDDRQILIRLAVQAGHPALLQGLDAWLQLGLVSQEWVRQICAEQLACPLPEPVVEQSPDSPDSALQPVGVTDFLPPEDAHPPLPRAADRPISLPAQWLQSFMAEVSVVWLLFLGGFLVVVSSGVLAATQWRNFSPLGQYSILLSFTLVFWLVTLWTDRQPNLQLTTQTLRIATLLIIPVNFWMMDGFKLWNSFPGIVFVTIAALLLTLITILLLKPSRAAWMTGTAIGLSWLQWGWGWQGTPFTATYVGTIAAAVALLVQEQRERERERYSLPPIAVTFGSLLLLLRAILVAQVPLNQLGLAIGISGWVLVWLARRSPDRRMWMWLGSALLIVGWAIAVSVIPPWQAIVITGLGLWLLGDGLRRTGEPVYLTTGFFVGFQGVWLLWRVIPPVWQQAIVRFCISLAGTEGMTSALSGIGFLPYVLATVWFAFRLRQWQRPALALQAEQLALIAGGLLTLISLANPTVRSLNLALSTLTLAIVLLSRPQPSAGLIYLTHTAALSTLISTLQRFLPTLSLHLWATFLLTLMLLEWIACYSLHSATPPPATETFHRNVSTTGPSTPPLPYPLTSLLAWKTSTWHFGLLFAGVSYILLALQLWQNDRHWSGVWLITPIALTILGSQSSFTAARLASWLSVFALFLLQPLMLGSTTERLLGLGTAAVLMLINTYYLRNQTAAVLTVGFGLSFEMLAFWEAFGDRLLNDGWFLLILAGTILALWVLRGLLLHRRQVFTSLYRQATDGWAIALTLVTLLLLSLMLLLIYLLFVQPSWQYTAASAVLVIATLYRTTQSATDFTYLILAWSVELLIAAALTLSGQPTRTTFDYLAIANLVLAVITQLTGDWQIAKLLPSSPSPPSPLHSSTQPLPPPTWHLIPLLYALFAIALHPFFTTTSALYTLIGAWVGIRVGRRLPSLKALTFLSVLVGSFAAHEFLVAQLRQVQGVNPNDTLIMLALLAAVLAIAAHLGQRWAMPWLRLSGDKWSLIANLHWGLGNFWLIPALIVSLSSTGEWLWLLAATLLATYALTKSHNRWRNFPLPPPLPSPHHFPWTYAGITESLIAIGYLLHRLLPATRLIDWSGTIAVGIALALYFGPWDRWGWDKRPWKQMAAVLPGVVILIVAWGINIQSLLMGAAFYAWLAAAEQQPRLSYIGVLLADWAILRIFVTYELREPLWFVMVLSASLLYVAQIDPGFQHQRDREKRHWLRSLATALICLTGFYQSEIGIAGVAPVFAGLLALALEFGFIVAGLLLRIRAFLYIGTVTFILQVLWQLWRFISDYSLMLWALGILVGLLLIWAAATFEARRAQVNTLMQQWASQLNQWE